VPAWLKQTLRLSAVQTGAALVDALDLRAGTLAALLAVELDTLAGRLALVLDRLSAAVDPVACR
jgi:hypothetical protein